jgi:hypothetical protein
LPTFGETRQFADFLAFLGMQRGRAAYAVTGETSSALRVSVAILMASPKVAKNPFSRKDDTLGNQAKIRLFPAADRRTIKEVMGRQLRAKGRYKNV